MFRNFDGEYEFLVGASMTGDDLRFVMKDARAALRKLKRLQVQGFGVPDEAIDRLREEIDQGSA